MFNNFSIHENYNLNLNSVNNNVNQPVIKEWKTIGCDTHFVNLLNGHNQPVLPQLDGYVKSAHLCNEIFTNTNFHEFDTKTKKKLEQVSSDPNFESMSKIVSFIVSFKEKNYGFLSVSDTSSNQVINNDLQREGENQEIDQEVFFEDESDSNFSYAEVDKLKTNGIELKTNGIERKTNGIELDTVGEIKAQESSEQIKAIKDGCATNIKNLSDQLNVSYDINATNAIIDKVSKENTTKNDNNSFSQEEISRISDKIFDEFMKAEVLYRFDENGNRIPLTKADLEFLREHFKVGLLNYFENRGLSVKAEVKGLGKNIPHDKHQKVGIKDSNEKPRIQSQEHAFTAEQLDLQKDPTANKNSRMTLKLLQEAAITAKHRKEERERKKLEKA